MRPNELFYNYLFGRTLAQRMEFRRRVLATTMADLRTVAERYFQPEQAGIGVITSKDGLAEMSGTGIEVINL